MQEEHGVALAFFGIGGVQGLGFRVQGVDACMYVCTYACWYVHLHAAESRRVSVRILEFYNSTRDIVRDLFEFCKGFY